MKLLISLASLYFICCSSFQIYPNAVYCTFNITGSTKISYYPNIMYFWKTFKSSHNIFAVELTVCPIMNQY